MKMVVVMRCTAKMRPAKVVSVLVVSVVGKTVGRGWASRFRKGVCWRREIDDEVEREGGRRWGWERKVLGVGKQSR